MVIFVQAMEAWPSLRNFSVGLRSINLAPSLEINHIWIRCGHGKRAHRTEFIWSPQVLAQTGLAYGSGSSMGFLCGGGLCNRVLYLAFSHRRCEPRSKSASTVKRAMRAVGLIL